MSQSYDATDFLADWQLGAALLSLISEARTRLLLVSPFHKHWGHLRQEIAAADRRGVKIRIYYRATEPDPAPAYGDRVISVPVKLLHSKIYVSESRALITSLNLFDPSASHNRECGILTKDFHLRRAVNAYIAGLGPPGQPLESCPPPPGFCIACRCRLRYDPTHPLCPECFARHGRSSRHRCCHGCGQAHPSTLGEPECARCRAVPSEPSRSDSAPAAPPRPAPAPAANAARPEVAR